MYGTAVRVEVSIGGRGRIGSRENEIPASGVLYREIGGESVLSFYAETPSRQFDFLKQDAS